MGSETRLTLTYDVSNCTTPTYHRYSDYNFTITFTADTGCEFIIGDTANNLEYENGDKWIPDNSRYITTDNIVNQVQMRIIMKDYPTNAVMHVKAYQIQPVTIPLTQNLTHCTSNITDTIVNPSTPLSITLTADNGYEFSSAPTYTINSTQSNFTRVSDTVYTAELTTPASGTIVVNATADISTKIPIIQNLTNCTSNFTDTAVNPATEMLIVLRANNNYKFDTENLPTYTINGFSDTFIRSAETACYAEFTAPASGSVVVNATAIDNRYTVEFILSHCSATPNISRIDYSQNITITITADTGYKFENQSRPYYYSGNTGIYYFTKVNDYTYTLNTDDVSYKRELEIHATATQEITPPVPSTDISYGFVNIYLPTIETLQALSKRRFYDYNDERQDMFKFVYKVHKMYFNIPATNETTIALAYYRTGITCFETDNAFVSANCGSVVVSELYGNVYDYQYTTSKIYLPFIGYQILDTASIMNSTVNLEYRANIITGKTIAVISTLERGELYQFEGYGGFDIPYMINEFNTSINHDLYQSSAYLGNFTPSLQLFTNIPYGNDANNVFGYGVSKWCKIGDCTGYIRCEDIQLIISQNYITNSEMNMITALLKDGVFIGDSNSVS